MSEAAPSTAALDVVPGDSTIGAEIRGLDLRQELSEEQISAVRRTLLDYCVLVFRNQQIDDQHQVRFTSYFGTPMEHVRKQRKRELKEIFIISNVTENDEPIGALGNGLIDFHSDLSYLRNPGTISVLYAIEVPDAGGDTQWCDCRAAYDALDYDLSKLARSLHAVHRHPVPEQNRPEPVDHPVVRCHPETKRASLYVSPHLTSHLRGVDEDESEQLLRRFYEHMDQPQFIYSHSWRVGDLLMWDNRPTMHRRLAFPDEQRRVMKRTQIFGEEVVE
ncbi:MAG: TauD/TfdA family dioxygenase [Candidatus Latescibacterota bacterium]|nr:TauD/TfdA family dioxygenase [Candidatus Latescibacterota bacterium]